MKITATYESLPKIAKIIIQIVLGGLFSAIYRIIRFVETKNVVTLIAGIVCFTPIGFVAWILDLVTQITKDKISILAD